MVTANRDAPAPGLAPLVAPNAAALLRRNANDPAIARRVAIKFADRSWTHREYYEESCRFARLFLDRLPPDAPRHVAVLLDNTPDYLFAFGGAAHNAGRRRMRSGRNPHLKVGAAETLASAARSQP